MEHVQNVNEIDHPSVRVCLEYKNTLKGLKFTMTVIYQQGRGLAQVIVYCWSLNSLACFKGEEFSKIELAKQAIHIEQNKLSEYVGVQDQIMAANGGFQEINLNKNEPWKISKMNFQMIILKNLKVIYFLGLVVFQD